MVQTEVYVDKDSDLFKECKDFWKYWISTHKRQWQNIVRGLPQFE